MDYSAGSGTDLAARICQSVFPCLNFLHVKDGEQFFGTNIDLSIDLIKSMYMKCCMRKMYGISITCKDISPWRNSYVKL